MKEWNVIHEADDEETGKPSLWSLEVNSEEYGRFFWISLDSKKKYNVEAQLNGEYTVLKSFRSLKSAKAWAESLVA